MILLIPNLIFLFFNFSKKFKIFLGNNGSATLGLLLSSILIYFSNVHYEIFPPSLIIWLVSLFFFEFISTNLSRYLRQKDIFYGGRDHLHYFILERVKSKYFTVFCILTLNQVFILFGFLLLKFNEYISFIIFTISFIAYFYLREKILFKQYAV